MNGCHRDRYFGRLALAQAASLIFACSTAETSSKNGPGKGMPSLNEGPLPSPQTGQGMSLNKALRMRRSVRSFGTRGLTLEEIGQILWAGQGKTSANGFRTAPSAGATFPLELHVLTVDGVFRYGPNTHELSRLSTDDKRSHMASAALGQSCVEGAAATFVIAGVISRTSGKYGKRAGRYVALEAGAAAQNMLLQVTALGLGGVIVGAYDDDKVRDIARLPPNSIPLAIISVGAMPAE